MPSPQFDYAEIDSPVGTILVAARGGCLISLDFSDFRGRFDALLAKRFPQGYHLVAHPDPAGVGGRLAAYFEGTPDPWDGLAFDLGGTPFQMTVWAALRTIPFGTTQSYGTLARRLGKPSASRAVGAANGQNPIAIIIPCHRVIGASGSMTGYGGGLDRKRALLRHEGVIGRDLL